MFLLVQRACNDPTPCQAEGVLLACTMLLYMLTVFTCRHRVWRREQRMAPFHAILEIVERYPENDQIRIGAHLREIFQSM